MDFYIRSRPARQFEGSLRRGLGQDQWHTYAVEVTPARISWFVDASVIRTERRPKALSGTKFQVRFTMQAIKGKRMNPARMQMDWLRYWTLHGAQRAFHLRRPRPDRTNLPQGLLSRATRHCQVDYAGGRTPWAVEQRRSRRLRRSKG